MPDYIVPNEIRNQSIEWLNLKPENMAKVRKTGALTVEELLPYIEKLPRTTARAIKKKIMFNMDDT